MSALHSFSMQYVHAFYLVYVFYNVTAVLLFDLYTSINSYFFKNALFKKLPFSVFQFNVPAVISFVIY